jgi:WD40-like Beta Propeller Repeat
VSARGLSSLLALAATLACCPLCESSQASVSFTPFEVASVTSAGLQAEYAYEPVISANGEYVAFTGIFGSRYGVWRKDIATPSGKLELVAEGAGAGAPSISANGRYVSFTTADQPESGEPLGSFTGEPPTETYRDCTQVYRRDMGTPENPTSFGEASAYRVASALSGPSDTPLTYAGSSTLGCPGGGAATSTRSAISANGNRVVFTVLGESDLDGPAPPTPPGQVAVRNFEAGDGFGAEETMLVSVEKGSQTPVETQNREGAALSGVPFPKNAQTHRHKNLVISSNAAGTAAISANGNAIAWMGNNVQAQVFTTRPESPHVEYAEPLWREITGPGDPLPTRSVLGGDDPSAPGCPLQCIGGLNLEWNDVFKESFETFHGPQLGSFVDPEPTDSPEPPRSGFAGSHEVTPRLNADGSEVAILSTQPAGGQKPEFGPLQPAGQEATANAFLVRMTPGLTRGAAITRLTEWGSPSFSEQALDGSVETPAISGDGTRLAFSTTRTVFPLAPPALITPPVTEARASQVYQANLQGGTLALVSNGYNGEPANEGVDEVALSENGEVLAMASGASNLAFGAVDEGSAVFVTREEDSPNVPGSQSVSALPLDVTGKPTWSISATASPSTGGALLIDVSVPASGRLAVSASAPVPTKVTVRGRAGKAAGRARKRRTVTEIASRQVAHAGAGAAGPGLMQLRLLPSTPYRSLASTPGGLYASITVTFAAPGHSKLTETLRASFPRVRQAAKPSVRKPKRKSPRRGHA